MDAVDNLRQRQGEIKTRLREIDAASNGDMLTEEQRAEWNDLNKEFDALAEQIKELEARAARLAALYDQESSKEDERAVYSRPKTRKRVPDDLHDFAGYRTLANNLDELGTALEEGALRVNERMSILTEGADESASRAKVEKVLRQVDGRDDRSFAKRIINTTSPTYMRAWAKYVANQPRTPDEERALSLTVGEGGYAVPSVLDPTVILVSAGYVNPVRSLARVETITGNTWEGISSTGVTASYGAEATEASDNAPSLVQPTANVEKAQAFIPFSIEIGQDWGALGAEMGRLFADAKDDLESYQFLHGLGHASNAPQGLIAAGGATAVVTSAATATFAVADLYSLENALSPRFRRNATFVGNKAAYQKVRQFDTSGGANLWVQLQYGEPATLLGYRAAEWSDYVSTVTTSASTILTFGDFSKFLIVDRVGMDVELVPHLFATANNRPTGQRGLYAYWRNTSKPLTPSLQANSAFVSLKLL